MARYATIVSIARDDVASSASRAATAAGRVYLFLRFVPVRRSFVADCAVRCSRTAFFVAAVFSLARAISLAVISADFLAVSSWSDSFFRRARTLSSCSGRTHRSMRRFRAGVTINKLTR